MRRREGNRHRTGEDIAFIEDDVDGLEIGYPNLDKFARRYAQVRFYIASIVGSLINHGERFRSGERISSCLAESTANAVISKRFAKRQQMQWSKRDTGECAPERIDGSMGLVTQLAFNWRRPSRPRRRRSYS